MSQPLSAQLSLTQPLAEIGTAGIVPNTTFTEIRDYAELRAESDPTGRDATTVSESCLVAFARKAVDDGVVTRAERAESNDLAEQLGVDARRVKATLDLAEAARRARLSYKLRPLPSASYFV